MLEKFINALLGRESKSTSTKSKKRPAAKKKSVAKKRPAAKKK